MPGFFGFAKLVSAHFKTDFSGLHWSAHMGAACKPGAIGPDMGALRMPGALLNGRFWSRFGVNSRVLGLRGLIAFCAVFGVSCYPCTNDRKIAF